MPVLPDLPTAAPLQTAPLPYESPDAATLVARTVQDGMGKVANTFSLVVAHQAAVKRAQESQSVATAAVLDLEKMVDGYNRDPDPATAGERFRDQATSWQQSVLDKIEDPETRAFVGRHLASHVQSGFATVMRQSAHRQSQAFNAQFTADRSSQALKMASASSPSDLEAAVNLARDSIAQAERTGMVPQGSAGAYFSDTVRQAILAKASTDPAAAARLRDQFRGDLMVQDLTAVEDHLRAPLQRQSALSIGLQANGPLAGPPAAQADPVSDARARAVHDGFVRLGWSDAVAWGLAANAWHEGGANPSPAAGDGGRSRGLFQWNADRLAAFQARYGVAPDQAPLAQQIEFADAELRGSEAKAGAALRAARSPSEAASIASRLFLRPADTEGQAQARAATAARLSGVTDARPTIADVMARADALSSGMPEEARMLARARAIEIWHQHDAAFAVARADAVRQASDLEARYTNGFTDAPVPVDAIRHAFTGEPDKAEAMIRNLTLTRQAGDTFRAIRWASPAEQAAAVQSLAVTPANENDGAARQRIELGQRLQTIIQQNQHARDHDPMAYVMANPEVAAAFKAANPEDPRSVAAAYEAARTLQTKLGLRPDQLRSLTNAQAAAEAARFAAWDPAKQDAGVMLADAEKRYGAAWSGVWSDIVKHGKVPREWMILAAMDHPGQETIRQDVQRMMVLRMQKGGIKELRQQLNDASAAAIDKGLDETMEPLRATTIDSAGGLDLLHDVRETVRSLAYYYSLRGDDPNPALRKAFEGVIERKYDLRDSMRLPRQFEGKPVDTAQVASAAFRVQAQLDPADVAAPPPRAGMPGETEQDRRAALVTAARNGHWITNADGTGIVLLAKLRDGQTEPVIAASTGQPLEIRFDRVPRGGGSRWDWNLGFTQ